MEILNNQNILPFVPLRDTVIFPTSIVPLNLGRKESIHAAESALNNAEKYLVVSCQKKSIIESPEFCDIYKIGTLVKILQSLKIADGSLKILVEGIARVEIVEYIKGSGHIEVKYVVIPNEQIAENSVEIEALQREVKSEFEEYIKLYRKLPPELSITIHSITELDKLADTIASYLPAKLQDKQDLLETVEIKRRLEKLIKLIIAEKEILKLEEKLHTRVKSQIEKSQKEYYLTEQMKAIQKELKQKDDFAKEVEELHSKIKSAKMPKEVEETAVKELQRLEKMMPFSPEATVVRTYLDWLIALPWSIKTQDNIDIRKSKQFLDEDHYGLEKVKDRILEYLSVLKRVKKLKVRYYVL